MDPQLRDQCLLFAVAHGADMELIDLIDKLFDVIDKQGDLIEGYEFEAHNRAWRDRLKGDGYEN
jgi:hypothetical protein